MEFELNEEQLAIKNESILFAQNELNDDIIARDHDAAFSREGWNLCAEFGIHGLPFPEQYGGSEADIVSTMLAMEGLGYGSRDAGLIFAINAQMWSIQMPIVTYGTQAQKEKYLQRLCSGEIIGAHGMSEPNSGSDAFSLRTTAIKQDDGSYVLNGTKTWVTSAPIADMFIVFANTDPSGSIMGISGFIVDLDNPGIRAGKAILKTGLKTSPMSEVIMEDCVVPADGLIGKIGQGMEIFSSSMEWERSCILAGNLGAMQRQLETCVDYANERVQYKHPIASYPAIGDKMVNMKVRLEAARLLLYKVAWAKQQKQDATMEAAMVKIFLSEAYVQSCLDAVQIHGAYGFTIEGEMERELRNALGGKLYSGTSEIQRNILARRLGL